MLKKIIAMTLVFLLVLSVCGCAADPVATEESQASTTADEVDILTELGLTADAKGASEYTVQVNSALYSLLDFTDTSE